jgi:hypothetical protein
MITGGQAVLIYGEPRLTKDIDITLGVNIESLNKIKEIISRLDFKILLDEAELEDFVKKTMVIPLIDEKSGIRIDLVFSFSPYERQAIGRAKDIKLGKNTVKFASLEDLIIHKIIAGRARDLEDVRTILLKNSIYDREYISRWLNEFDEALYENFFERFREIEEDL